MVGTVVGIVGTVVGIVGIVVTLFALRRGSHASSQQGLAYAALVTTRREIEDLVAELAEARAAVPVAVPAAAAEPTEVAAARPAPLVEGPPSAAPTPPRAAEAIRKVLAKHGSDRPTATRLLQLASARQRDLVPGDLIGALEQLAAAGEVRWDGEPDHTIELA